MAIVGCGYPRTCSGDGPWLSVNAVSSAHQKRPARAAAVQEVDFYYTPGHPGVEQPHYHVILWHVPEETAELR